VRSNWKFSPKVTPTIDQGHFDPSTKLELGGMGDKLSCMEPFLEIDLTIPWILFNFVYGITL
jgi:hypothetical protein